MFRGILASVVKSQVQELKDSLQESYDNCQQLEPLNQAVLTIVSHNHLPLQWSGLPGAERLAL